MQRLRILLNVPASEGLKVYYLNTLGLGLEDRVFIDFDVMTYTISDNLVILRENMESPGIQLLVDELRLSLRARANRLP